MDDSIESFGKLGDRFMFITNGGTWIKNWIADALPKALSILDNYPVYGHLHSFATAAFSDEAKMKNRLISKKNYCYRVT